MPVNMQGRSEEQLLTDPASEDGSNLMLFL